MKTIAHDRWMISDASLFSNRIYPLLNDPKKNLSRCRQPAKLLFALKTTDLYPVLDKAPKFAT